MARDRPIPTTTDEALQRAALRYLERFAASTEMLRRVLMRRVERAARAGAVDRRAGAALVETVVERFARSGVLDDGGFAAARARTLLRQGRPRARIAQMLAAKGVGRDQVQAALASLAEETPDADLDAAIAFARRRRLGPFRDPAGRADNRDRDIAAMGRAGFALDLARRIVAAHNPGDLERLRTAPI